MADFIKTTLATFVGTVLAMAVYTGAAQTWAARLAGHRKARILVREVGMVVIYAACFSISAKISNSLWASLAGVMPAVILASLFEDWINRRLHLKL